MNSETEFPLYNARCCIAKWTEKTGSLVGSTIFAFLTATQKSFYIYFFIPLPSPPPLFPPFAGYCLSFSFELDAAYTDRVLAREARRRRAGTRWSEKKWRETKNGKMLIKHCVGDEDAKLSRTRDTRSYTQMHLTLLVYTKSLVSREKGLRVRCLSRKDKYPRLAIYSNSRCPRDTHKRKRERARKIERRKSVWRYEKTMFCSSRERRWGNGQRWTAGDLRDSRRIYKSSRPFEPGDRKLSETLEKERESSQRIQPHWNNFPRCFSL